MKNFMKKLFLLLLVGVIAVSMFGFIAPNRVDAKEAKPSRGNVCVGLEFGTGYVMKYNIIFYDTSGKQIDKIIQKYGLVGGIYKNYSIPEKAGSIIVEAQKLPITFRWKTVACHKFELIKNSKFSEGNISVVGTGRTLDHAKTTPKGNGCWKCVS